MAALVDLYRVDHQALVAWVCKTYGVGVGVTGAFDNPHRLRREAIAARLDLYRDRLKGPLGKIIDQIYKSVDLQNELKDFIDVSRAQNVSRRIVNEVASLYDRPALRVFDTDEETARFRAEEQRLSLHFIQQEAHRLTNLCNETLLWQFKAIEENTALRIVTPNLFDAISDPRDTLTPAGYLIDAPRASALPPDAASKLPCWELWDDRWRYLINPAGRMVDEAGEVVVVPEEHKLGRIPCVLLHRREPTECILDASYGEDIKSAHVAVALINMLAIRLAKSQGENIPVLKGLLAHVASNQVLHPERPIALPPGVDLAMLEMKSDPEHFLKLKRDIIASVGASYGLSYESFMVEFGGDSGSGKSYQVRREKLTELRIEQRARAKKHEAMVAELMGFKPEALRVDFQEVALPLDAMEEVELLDKKMRMGIDSIVDFMMRKDPDLSRDQVKKKILDNLEDFQVLITAIRALNIPGDADAANPGRSPQQNGADNKAKSSKNKDEMRAIAREVLRAA